jgi:hypothetical protein
VRRGEKGEGRREREDGREEMGERDMAAPSFVFSARLPSPLSPLPSPFPLYPFPSSLCFPDFESLLFRRPTR